MDGASDLTAGSARSASAGLFREAGLIAGRWSPADDGGVLAVTDPATGETLGHVPKMGAVETERAVAAATAALPAWRARPAQERAAVLHRWAALMRAQSADLAALLTAEQGKPLAEAMGEVAYAAGFLDWFGEEARRVYGDLVPAPASDRRILVAKAPVGVVAAITPWNFPAAMVTRKAGAALAAGCTLVLKPSELTPFTALALAALGEAAGVPPGVLNVVTGAPEVIGAVLTGDPRVRKLSFTGSTRVGKLLAAQCAGTVKRLGLELGGNAALIVFDDADLDVAVEQAMHAKFRNAGQTCVSANRILVQGGVHDAFAARLAERAAALKVGDGREGAQIGPLIDAAAVAKVRDLVADAIARGAQPVGPARGVGEAFYAPLVLTGATPDMRLAQEEIFGPVAPLFRFETEDEALSLANGTPYGLAAYVFTRALDRLFRVSETLEIGMVGFNTAQISSEVGPFGGVKESGYGREGSRYGLDDYLELKQIVLAA